VYLTADTDADGTRDRWVAISVADEEQWVALAAAIDVPAWSRDRALGTVAGRRAVEDDLDATLAAWCATRGTPEIVAVLSGAGVPTEAVVPAHEHDRLEPVVWRRLFEAVEHPVTGVADFIGAPFRHARGPHVHNRRPAPLLGEHNRDVLTRILGLTDAAVDELEAAGVIGDVVVGGLLH
jgi:crotonobetainyl-CoA:carnitine CoA-transferase CaiB-like acyl-CoA transferase